MTFFQVSHSVFNVDAIVQIQRIAVNNYTIFLSDGRSFATLTKPQIEPLLNVIGIDL